MNPKQYKIAFLAVTGLLLVVLVLSFSQQPTDPVVDRLYATESSDVVGYSFTYPTDQTGFHLDKSAELNEPDGLRQALFLVPQSSIDDYQNPGPGTELPPMISVYIFDNIRSLSIEDWLKRFDDFSRLNLAISKPVETTYGGMFAFRYEADGLYRANIVAIKSDGKIALLIGEYNDSAGTLYSDFWSIVGSFFLAD